MTDGNIANRMQCPLCGMVFATFDAPRKHNCLRSSAHITTTPAPAMTQPPEAGNLFDPAAFGARVLAKLEADRMSCREAAPMVPCSPATLNRVSRGNAPDVENYLRLSRWLGDMTPAEIIENYGRGAEQAPAPQPDPLSPAPSQGDVERLRAAIFGEMERWHIVSRDGRDDVCRNDDAYDEYQVMGSWPFGDGEMHMYDLQADAVARAAIAAMPVSAGNNRWRRLTVAMTAACDRTRAIRGKDEVAVQGRDWRKLMDLALSDDDGKEGR